MLVSALTQETDALQLTAHRRSLHTILLRQPIAQRAIGVAELERLDRLLGADPTALEIIERLGTGEQGLVVVVDHLDQQFRILGVALDRCRQFSHAAAFRGQGAGRRSG